jgi:hypothetical protein
MMDQTAFLTVDFGKIASGLIEENVIETLYSLQKITFDPENIGAEAKRKHIFRNVLAQLDGLYAAPSEAFVRMLLQGAGMSHLRQKLLDEYTPLVQDAFREFINQHILQRLSLGTASKETPATAEKAPVPIEPVLDSKIETTEQELALFAYVKQKLAFLVSDKILYDEITHIDYRDYQAKFVIFYRKERKGAFSISRKWRTEPCASFSPTGSNLTRSHSRKSTNRCSIYSSSELPRKVQSSPKLSHRGGDSRPLLIGGMVITTVSLHIIMI